MQASLASKEKPLPRQILRRSAEIKERFNKAHADPNNPAATAVPQAPVPGTPETATAADPKAGDPPAVAAPIDPRENDPAYWKQRFQATQGVLRTEKAAAAERETGLHQRIDELTEQVRTLQAAAPQPEADLGEFLTPEQIELLGPDEARTIVNTVLKGAQKEVAKLVEAEIAPLKAAKAQTEQRTQEDLKREFLEKITALVPDFEEVDNSDEWHEWLAEEDPGTGLQRQAALTHHLQRLDAPKVAKMFDAFKAGKPKPPAPPVAPSGSGANAGGNPPVAAPGASGFRPSPAEITAFYKRKSTIRKGQPGYVTDEEAREFEKRLKLPPRRQ